jgi:hypothetical protein
MSPRILVIAAISALVVACQPASPPADPAAGQAPVADPVAPAPAAAEDADRPHDVGDPAEVSRRDTTPVDTRVAGVRFSDSGDTESHLLGVPVDTFPSRIQTIYAEVETIGTAGEYTLYAKWLDPQGNALSDYGMRLSSAGPVRTVISLGKPDGWAPGTYRVEVAVNSQAPHIASFQVR